jgi:hypothetical protein
MSCETLPLEGSLLRKIEFQGTGKRQYCILAMQDRDLPLDFAVDGLEIHIAGRVTTHIDGMDDVTVRGRYLPLEPIRIAQCLVGFPGTPEEWQETLRNLFSMRDPFGYVLEGARIDLVADS